MFTPRPGVDLSLTGHAHGGQFRIPFVGGVFAPAQGFFPRYDAGLYLQGQSAMVVSRGIGQSVIPVRLNNRPEIVLIELRREADSAQKFMSISSFVYWVAENIL